MHIEKANSLLNKFDIKTILKESFLSQDNNPFENYMMIKKDKEKWFYGMFHREREKKPYFSPQKIFDNESDAAKFFFLDILSSEYLAEILSPEYRKTLSLDIYENKFDVDKFRKLMEEKNISQNIFLTDKENIRKRRAVTLFENQDGQFTEGFVDKNGILLKNYKIIENNFSYFETYKQVFKLNFFEKEVIPVLKEMKVYNEFTEEDVYQFITYMKYE